MLPADACRSRKAAAAASRADSGGSSVPAGGSEALRFFSCAPQKGAGGAEKRSWGQLGRWGWR